MKNQPTVDYSPFHGLTIKDLLEARDLFHYDFMIKKNVIATAVGKYLIRGSDFDDAGNYQPKKNKGKRTLDNSLITPFSWPCILVFVEQWETPDTLLKNATSSDLIPKKVRTKDLRDVPVCVVEAPRQRISNERISPEQLNFPTNLIGGGFPLMVNSQGVEYVASVGCVVSDGHKFYALTNKHVTGDSGAEVFSRFGGETRRIGLGSSKLLGKVEFTKLYPKWSGNNVLVNCDAGLIELEDTARWKTDILGIGQMGDLLDLHEDTFTLTHLAHHQIKKKNKTTIKGKVVGYGAISGKLEGELLAYFYRYKSIGGKEYVCDFLIGGSDGKALNVHRGDSGTLWLKEEVNDKNEIIHRPFALHWGQHEVLTGTQRETHSYSMAANLTTIFRELDLDPTKAWNADNDYSWGKVGHYTVGTASVSAVKLQGLKQFMKNNLTNISFDRSDITKELGSKDAAIAGLSADPDKGFCALADVPDIVWKKTFTKETPWGRRGAENPNHYADVDAPTVDGKTMFDLCNAPDKLTPKVWKDYYQRVDKKATGITKDDPSKYGLICFRVWQIFDYMVAALKDKRADKFLFAAGVLTHYVGDACQPLHSSYMSDGNPKDTKEIDYTAKKTSYHRDGTISHEAGEVYKKEVNPGSGVHVAYEDHMVDDHIDIILTNLFKTLDNSSSKINKESIMTITNGQEAGYAVLLLMQKTQKTIAPVDIVETFKNAKGKGNVSDTLYKQFGLATADCLARGSRYLAAIWEAAWKAGGGGIPATKVSEAKLIKLYRNPKELPSMRLDTIGSKLK